MPATRYFAHSSLALIVSLLMTACGGGGGGDGQNPERAGSQPISQTDLRQEPNAPEFLGNTASDGFNWFNYRRRQAGLSAVTSNTLIANAAQGHSNYQRINDTITHLQARNKSGFTGVTPTDRLVAAAYGIQPGSYIGEVISATTDGSGFVAAESLIAAIYHRFVILEPRFKEAGSGAATVNNGFTYFTTDFAADRLEGGLGPNEFITYPFANQRRVPRVFLSDQEVPDPVPAQNAVGYPVSIHANAGSTVTVQTFNIRARGGAQLPVRLLTRETDAENTHIASVAAIVPLSTLKASTTYDVQFVGKIDGKDVEKTWSFTTQ